MFSHVMVGTNDPDKAAVFYDAVLSPLGVKGKRMGDRLFYRGPQGGAFGVGRPANDKSATFANGGTIGFQAENKDQIDAFHTAGIANGGSCEGVPGLRPNAPGKAYGAYLRDPDGNKICAFCQLKD